METKQFIKLDCGLYVAVDDIKRVNRTRRIVELKGGQIYRYLSKEVIDSIVAIIGETKVEVAQLPASKTLYAWKEEEHHLFVSENEPYKDDCDGTWYADEYVLTDNILEEFAAGNGLVRIDITVTKISD